MPSGSNNDGIVVFVHLIGAFFPLMIVACVSVLVPRCGLGDEWVSGTTLAFEKYTQREGRGMWFDIKKSVSPRRRVVIAFSAESLVSTGCFTATRWLLRPYSVG